MCNINVNIRTCTEWASESVVGFVLLDEEGLNKSSKLKVLAVWVGCNGLVKLNNEGFRIPSRPSNVLGFGDELAVLVCDTFTAVAIPL